MKVLLIEDHEAIRNAVASVVRSREIGEVVGETPSAEEGVTLAERTTPDLVVLDLRLGGAINGVEACREIKSLPEPPRVIIYTSYSSPAEIYLCRLAGADGYVNKRASLEELTDAMRRVASGESVWPESGRRTVVDDATLTDRERDVLALAMRGWANPRIATELHVSLPTVKSHIRSILRKLGLGGRGEIPTTRLWEED